MYTTQGTVNIKRTMPAYLRYGGDELAVSSSVALSSVGEVTAGAAGAASVGSATGDEIMGATSAADDGSVRVGSSSRSCWINNG